MHNDCTHLAAELQFARAVEEYARWREVSRATPAGVPLSGRTYTG